MNTNTSTQATPEQAALREAIEIAGGQSALARQLGSNVKQAHVWWWLNKSQRIPGEYVIPVERVTGVPRHRLRPDLYPPEGYTPPEPPDRRSGADRRQSGCRRADQSPGRRQGDDRRAAADRRREETDAA